MIYNGFELTPGQHPQGVFPWWIIVLLVVVALLGWLLFIAIPRASDRLWLRRTAAGIFARMARQITVGDVKHLAAARAFIEREFRRVPNLDDIARVAGFSPYHFHRLFRHHFSQTPKRYVDELRIKEVQRLALGGTTFTEAGRQLGFPHQSHMIVCFKRVVGKTPGKWLKAERTTRQ